MRDGQLRRVKAQSSPSCGESRGAARQESQQDGVLHTSKGVVRSPPPSPTLPAPRVPPARFMPRWIGSDRGCCEPSVWATARRLKTTSLYTCCCAGGSSLSAFPIRSPWPSHLRSRGKRGVCATVTSNCPTYPPHRADPRPTPTLSLAVAASGNEDGAPGMWPQARRVPASATATAASAHQCARFELHHGLV